MLFHHVSKRTDTAPGEDILLSHFLLEGVDLVSGYATGLIPFLTSLVPQIGREYPAAKYALLSVAARTRSVQLRFSPHRRRAEAMSLTSTALSHCNTAFRCLTRAGDTQHMPPEVYMVCGALFASTEGWPHRDMLPLTHILNAHRIFFEGNNRLLSEDVKDVILPYLVHLGRSCIAFHDEIPEHLSRDIRHFSWFDIGPKPVPRVFAHINEALLFVEDLLKYVLASTDSDETFQKRASVETSRLSTAIARALHMTRADLLSQKDPALDLSYRALLMHTRTVKVLLEMTS